jgi:hypothetical protein
VRDAEVVDMLAGVEEVSFMEFVEGYYWVVLYSKVELVELDVTITVSIRLNPAVGYVLLAFLISAIVKANELPLARTEFVHELTVTLTVFCMLDTYAQVSVIMLVTPLQESFCGRVSCGGKVIKITSPEIKSIADVNEKVYRARAPTTLEADVTERELNTGTSLMKIALLRVKLSMTVP